MTPKEITDSIKARLHGIADMNGDGRVDKQDVERVAALVASQADAQVRKYPWAGVTVAVVIVAAIGFASCHLFHG